MKPILTLTSIITVNFNGGELLTECIRAALTSTTPVEIIVSDNGSTDGSIHYLKKNIQDVRLTIIKNNKNLGFSKANNIVLPGAQGQYILFLNPDCLIQPSTIKTMLEEIKKHKNIGMAGCLIRNLDGSEQAGCRRRVPTPWRTFVRVFHLHRLFPSNKRFQCCLMQESPLPKKSIPIEAISGAFMLVSREALDDIGMMDEGYFLHCEDLDWCMRFRQRGWRILFVPHVEITHAKGVCSTGRPVRVEWHKHKGMVRFYKKFFRHQYPLILMWGVIVMVWVRFVTIAMVETFKRLKF